MRGPTLNAPADSFYPGMLEVVHCIYDDPRNPWLGGGGARRVFELYRRLRDQVRATVLTGSFPGARDGEIEGVRYRHLGGAAGYAGSRLSYVAAAQRALRTLPYDVAVYDYSLYTPLRLPPGRRTATVVHMLQSRSAAQRWGAAAGRVAAAVERRLISQSPYVCVTSQGLHAKVEALLGGPPPHLRVVGSGIDDTWFEVERRESDYVLFFGRFDLFQKGLDTLLEAFDRLASTRPDLRLRIMGRGKDEAALRDLVRRSEFRGRIEVLDDPGGAARAAVFAGARLLLMPSRLEGLPMVPAESMAAGVPVVATSVGAVDEVVQPPHGGLLVPPDDASALAAAAARLLEDESLRQRVSSSARAAAERFRWEHVARRHLELLREAADAPPA